MGYIGRFMIGRRLHIYIFLLFFGLSVFASCGGAGPDYYDDVPTGSPPIVTRLDPAQGPVGTVVTIFGLGFSYIAPVNVVTMGDEGATAETYTLLANPSSGEVESITFTVPAGLAPGVYPVVVIVYDLVSNADVAFTVTP